LREQVYRGMIFRYITSMSVILNYTHTRARRTFMRNPFARPFYCDIRIYICICMNCYTYVRVDLRSNTVERNGNACKIRLFFITEMKIHNARIFFYIPLRDAFIAFSRSPSPLLSSAKSHVAREIFIVLKTIVSVDARGKKRFMQI